LEEIEQGRRGAFRQRWAADIDFPSSFGNSREKDYRETFLRHTGLILHDLIFLQAPGNPRRLGKKLADIMTVRTDDLVFVRKNAFQI
jgi:hypothetical protein